ncbi:MAG: hypothetical protein ABIV48_02375 [Pyrinomonadaceae bacterium]
MRLLFDQLKWQLLIFWKNNLLTMIIAITAVYTILIYAGRSNENLEKFITLLIYNDPAIIGFIFIGLLIIDEKDQGVQSALFVAPVSYHIFLLSRIITLSLIGCLGAVVMVFAAKGTSFNLVHFSVGAFATCVLFSFVGIFVVSFTTDVLQFFLRGAALLVLMSLPLLNYFELTVLSFLRLFPAQGGLDLIVNSYQAWPNVSGLIFGYVSIAIWIPLLYWFIYRVFVTRVVRV